MHRRVGVLLVLLAGLLATPALAAVERAVDAQGTIRITNLSHQAAQPRPSAIDQEETGLPAAEEVRARALAPAPPRLGSRPPAPLPAVSFPGALSYPTKQAPVAPVNKFTDGQGTIHITNVTGQNDRALAAAGEAPAPPEKPLRRNPRPVPKSAPLPVKALAPVPADLLLPVLSGPGPQAIAPPAGDGSRVRRFRDAKGVLHLVSEPRQAPERFLAQVQHLDLARMAAASLEWQRLTGSYAGGSLTVERQPQGAYRISNRPVAGKARKAHFKEQLEPILAEASLTYGLPVPLIKALVKAESNFNPQAVSPKGARGLMQLMPGTARDLGVKNAFCPRENVLGGCRYLRHLLNSFDQSLPLALAAYNAGHGRVVNAGLRVPEIRETQEFVTQVMGDYLLGAKRELSQQVQGWPQPPQADCRPGAV